MKLILFDIDGTLMLVKGAGREAKARTMENFFGMDAGVREHPFGGKTDWQIMNELLLDKGYTAQAIIDAIPPFQQYMADQLTSIIGDYPLEVCPGAHDVVAALRQRADVLLGVVTGNFALTAPVKLRAAGFDPAWFPVGAYGSESANRDDLPCLAIERAIKHTGQHVDPQDVIVIGDTLADIQCARAAGAVAVAVMTGFEHRDLLAAANPDYLLPDLTTFFDVVPV
jgi:phosphoglycolate phosphatase